MATSGETPTAIESTLRGEFGSEAPALRTINRELARLRELSPNTQAWEMRTAPPDEAPIVLAVLKAVIDKTEGQVVSLTTDQAAVLVRLRKAAPIVPGYPLYQIATEYLWRPLTQQDTVDLDYLIACLGVGVAWGDEAMRAALGEYSRLHSQHWADRQDYTGMVTTTFPHNLHGSQERARQALREEED